VEELVARLKRLDSCAVSDALDKLGLPSAVGGICARSAQVRIAGRVITVKLGLSDPSAVSVRHLCTQAIETAQSGDVIVVEQTTGIEAAGWGGVLSNAAMVRGIAGCIVDGPARDIDEARELDFPVYSRSTTSRTARGRIREVETGGPLSIGGVVVLNGDYVIADSSGVAFLPTSEAVRVVETAEKIVLREAAMSQDVRAGERVGKVMGASYESMLEKKS
jgi:regulator of RNase E activity RraA